jgi:hypothetical protein
MPANALALAFAASIYPPALAAVIALGRGPALRSRVFVFVGAAFLTTYAIGAAMLFLLEELGATSTADRSASAGLDLALGIVLIALAFRLQSKRPEHHDASAEAQKPSRIDRYLRSRRLAALLGVTLYIVPSPIYVGAVKAIADAKLSRASELLDLVTIVAMMLWLVELPMLLLLIAPKRAERALDHTNRWFAAHGRTLAVIAAAAAGVFLAVKGLVTIGE